MPEKTAQVICIGVPANSVKNFKEFAAILKDKLQIEISSRNPEIGFDATPQTAKQLLKKIENIFAEYDVYPATLRRIGKPYLFLKTQEKKGKTTEIEVCERIAGQHIPLRTKRKYFVHGTPPKYHAQIKGKPNIWAIGTSRNEVIGNLIHAFPEKFGITIKFL